MEFLDDFANHNSVANPGPGGTENGFGNDDWLDMALGITGSQDDWLLALENTDNIFNDEKLSKLPEKNGLGKGTLLRAAFSTGDLQSLANSADYSSPWGPLSSAASNRLESVPEHSATNGGPLATFHSNPTPPQQPAANQFPVSAAAAARSPSSPPTATSAEPLENLSIEQLEAQLSLVQQGVPTSPLPTQFDPANPFMDPLALPFPAPAESAASSASTATATAAPQNPATTSAVSMLPQIKQSPSSQDLAAMVAAAAAPSSQPLMAPTPVAAMDPNLPPAAPQLPFLMPGAMPQGPVQQYNTLLQPMGLAGAPPPMPSMPTQAPQLHPPSLPTLARPPLQAPTHPQQAPQLQHAPQAPPMPHPPGVPHPMGPMPMPGQLHRAPGDPQAPPNGMLHSPHQTMPGFSQQPQQQQQQHAFAPHMGPSGNPAMPMDYSHMHHRPQMPMFPGAPLHAPPHYPDMPRQHPDPSHAMPPHAMHSHPPPHMHPAAHHPHMPHPQHPTPQHPPRQPPGHANPPLSPPDAHPIHPRPMGGLRKSHSCVELASWRSSSSSLDLTDLAGSAKAVVGKLTPEERAQKLLRYRQKRNERNFNRTIKYQCRKTLADTRPRVRGRFARNNDPESVPPELTKKALRERARTDGGEVKMEEDDEEEEGGEEGAAGAAAARGYVGGPVLVHAQASSGGQAVSGGSAPTTGQQSSSVGTATSTDDSLELPSFSDPMAMLVDSAASAAPYDYLQGASSAPPGHASQPMLMHQPHQHQPPPQQHPALCPHFPPFPTAANPSP